MGEKEKGKKKKENYFIASFPIQYIDIIWPIDNTGLGLVTHLQILHS